MILQYNGVNRNKCFVEAQTIVYSIIDISSTVKRVQDEWGDIGPEEGDRYLEYRYDLDQAVYHTILEEFGEVCNTIHYLHISPIETYSSIAVVKLIDKDIHEQYVLPVGTNYLLNNNGKTILRF